MKPTEKQLYWMITNKRADLPARPVLLGAILRSTFRQINKPPRGMPRRRRRRQRSRRST